MYICKKVHSWKTVSSNRPVLVKLFWCLSAVLMLMNFNASSLFNYDDPYSIDISEGRWRHSVSRLSNHSCSMLIHLLTSFIASCNSDSVGFWPRDLITLDNSCTPDFMSLAFITLHLFINYFALSWYLRDMVSQTIISKHHQQKTIIY